MWKRSRAPRPFLLLLSLAFTGSAQTITPQESTILVAHPKKIGINLGGPTYYGAGELYKNLMWRNPGFEPDLYRDKFVAMADATSTTFISPNLYDPVVANFWAGGTFKLYRGAPKALVCSGSIASNTIAANNAGPTYTFASACSTPVVKGDVIVLRKSIDCTPEEDWEGSHAGWWAEISNGGRIGSDCATQYEGQQSIVLDASPSGSTAGVVAHIDTAAWVTGLLINGQYTISGHYKTIGSATLTVNVKRNVTGAAGNPLSCTSQSFPAAPTWASFSFNCTGAETAQLAQGDITVEMLAQGGFVELDDVSFQKTTTDATNTTPFRDEVVNALKQHCAGASLTGVPCELRDWAGQSADEIENTILPLFERQPAVNSTGYDYAGGQGYASEKVGFTEFLQLCEAIGAEPYYALPETTGADEGAWWIDYLNGSPATTMGDLRLAQGHGTSWLSIFPTIHLAMGNENWNEGGAGEGLGYRADAPDYYYDYSTDAAGVWGSMRSSASWPSGGAGIDLILGFQDGNVNYGIVEAMTRTGANSGELAPYTQAYVGDVAPLSALWNPLMYEVVANTTNSAATFYQQGNAIKAYGKLNVYEFDNSTTQGTSAVTQSVLDSFTDAAGYGTATALQGLQHLSFGIVDQNFFSLSEYYTSGPNGNVTHNWGAFVDLGVRRMRHARKSWECRSRTRPSSVRCIAAPW
ncbi:hypothetical protein ACFQBQ_16895 [Granulicella cerasi]|uniref:CBM-cenC domain-containing protein n=1 Tax=Granulicella cerasi TaxID=741063 RepID=A0ABW1ZET0_9BACT